MIFAPFAIAILDGGINVGIERKFLLERDFARPGGAIIRSAVKSDLDRAASTG